MRSVFVLMVLVAAIGCAKKDDPSAPSPSATVTPASSVGPGGAGTPYVAGAGPISPVQGGDIDGGGGGGIGIAAKDKARRVAGSAGNPAGTNSGGAGDESGN